MKIKGIIFDLDGVVTDTAEYHYLAWKKLSDEENMQFDRQVNEKLRGVSRRDSLQIILDHNGVSISDKELEKWMKRKNDYYISFLDKITEKDYLPGAKEFLEAVKKSGFKTALGSASKNAPAVLKNLNASKYFDVIGDGNSVKRSKPAPDLFLFAAKELGLNPEECVVIEDAESGIEAAHNAGMPAIGIGPVERIGKAEVTLANTSLLDIRMIENW